LSNKNEPRTTFQDRVVYFMGNVDSTLTSMDKRLSIIEGNMGQVCPAHDSLLQMITSQKDTNTNQKGQNVEVQRQQGVQDVGIRDLQEQSRFIEYKLSNKDLAKLSAIMISVLTIIMFVLERVFK
jgi:hypothetical protein